MKAGEAHAAFRALPVAPLDRVLPGTTLLLAPHPDDESIGCGGIVAALCAARRPPVVVVLTDGTGSHPGSPSWPAERLRRQRQQEAADAVALLDLPAGRLFFLDLPDTQAPQEGPGLDQAVSDLSRLAGRHGCDTVLTTWEHDPHCDHESAWRIGRALAAQDGLLLRAYPVWGWTLPPDTDLDGEVPAGWRVDIAPFLPAKAAAIAAHASQHGRLITDDPDGFVLPRHLLATFETRHETVLAP